jgi:hypothetical protein
MLYYFYLAKLGNKSLYLARKASENWQRVLFDNLANSAELDYSRFYVEDITTLRKKYKYLARYPVTKSTAGAMQAEWQLHFEINNSNNEGKFIQKMNSEDAANFLYLKRDNQNDTEVESLDIASIFANNPEIYHSYINILTILGVLEVLIASNQPSFASGHNFSGAGSMPLSFYLKYREFNIFNTAPNYKPYFNFPYVTNNLEEEDDYFSSSEQQKQQNSSESGNNSRQDNMPHDYPDNYWYY